MIKKAAAFITFCSYLLFPQPVLAHSFGVLYNLPVPFWMYLYGGAAAILISFLIIGFFMNKTHMDLSYPTKDLSQYNIVSLLMSKRFLIGLKILSVFLFFLTIISGIIGTDLATLNFGMTFFWIIFILFFAYMSGLFGNIFEVINPLKVIVEIFEKILNFGEEGIVKYPKKLGYYPAIIFYMLFIWIELMGNISPSKLSFIIIQYSAITIFGTVIFGKDLWFQKAEFLSVFFRMYGRMSLIEYQNLSKKSGKFLLRPPFVGLLKEKAGHFSLLIFILFMLSSTAFDGLHSTTTFYRFYESYFEGMMTAIAGDNSYIVFKTIMLILSPFIFLVIYLAILLLVKILVKTKISFKELCLQFAFPLIPIAFVYNIAHYYTLIITEGPNIIRLISDPFGMGWNLFGTSNWYSGLQAVDTGIVWHSQVGLILFGHIVGVYLSHIVALRLFPYRRQALLSQIPMLLLMVTFTLIGLWILSQPITSGL